MQRNVAFVELRNELRAEASGQQSGGHRKYRR